MNKLEDSNVTNNKGVTFLNIWKTSGNIADLQCAIQHFEKALVAARTEGAPSFEIAENNLKLAKGDLAKYDSK